MDFPGRLIAGFLAIILCVLFPLQYVAQSHNENIDKLVDNKTQELSDTIRNKGYLDRAMYERYMKYLDTTGELYDVQIDDIHPVTGEEVNEQASSLSQPFVDKVSNAQVNKNQLSFTKMKILSSDNNLTLNSEADFSFTEDQITRTATTTIYVDELISISVTPYELTVERYTPQEALSFTVLASYQYGEDKTIPSGYQISGYSPSVIGTQTLTISYTENDVIQTSTVNVIVTVLHRKCSICQQDYELNEDDTDPGCPYCSSITTGISVAPEYIEVIQGENLPISVNVVKSNGATETVTGWTSNYDSSKSGLQIVTVEYDGFAYSITVWVNEAMKICTICGNEYPASAEHCPICASTVISISVIPNEIIVKQYDDIEMSVVANYADGSSGSVSDWSIDHTSSEAGIFTANVFYQNVSTTITLNVISASIVVCSICGLSYEPVDNPSGCPVCSNVIIGIEAYLTSGSNLVQYGTTPTLTIMMIYLDTHREITTIDYTIENYDKNQLGEQTIYVHYGGFVTSNTIVVVDTLTSITCTNGHVYYLNDDGTDSGCPYCNIAESLETVYFFDITYLNEILDVVYTDGIYYFDSNDYITIKIVKKDLSLLTNMQKMGFRTALIGRRRRYIYGGEIG